MIVCYTTNYILKLYLFYINFVWLAGMIHAYEHPLAFIRSVVTFKCSKMEMVTLEYRYASVAA